MPTTYFVSTPGLRKGRVQLSKRVLRRIEAARALRSSIEVFKAEAEDGFGRRLAAELRDGETMPDQGLSLELVTRWTTTAGRELKELEYAYCREGSERVALGRRCKKAAKKLYPRVVHLRRVIDSTFGKEDALLVHGFEGKTKRKPQRLHDQMALLMERLKDPRFELPKPVMKSTRADRGEWLGMVEDGYDRLGDLLEELAQSELDEVGARDLRDMAIRRFDEVYGDAVTYVGALFAVAGLDERFAKVLKPYAERRRLARKARQERQARAEGRRQKIGAGLRAAVATVSGWLGRRVA